MKRYLITAGLLFGLAGLSASAQTTPNTDPNHPQAGVPSTPPTFPSDQQQGTTPSQSPSSQDPTATTQDPKAQPSTTAPDTDRTNRGQADADQTTSNPTSSQSGSTAGQGSMSSSQSSDQSTTGATGSAASPNSEQSTTGATGSPQDQSAPSGSSSTGSAAGGASAGGDAKTQIESAFQQQGLTGVQANVSTDSIELTGTVPTGEEKKEAKKIAQQHANGLKVVDHLKVEGKGEAKQ